MIESMKIVPIVALVLLAMTASADERTIEADVWADNWFALYLETTLIKEDSVEYNTEDDNRSGGVDNEIELYGQLLDTDILRDDGFE